jgi:AraC-like DNA-binding protein
MILLPDIKRWSTDDVRAGERLDYYAAALTAAVDPMHVAAGDPDSFAADVRSVEFGPMSIIRARAGEHRCVRDARDISNSSGSHFHLIMNLLSPWTLAHRGRVRLRPGDAVILDSRFAHEITLPVFHIVHLKFDEAWLQRWVPAPAILTGRVIARDSKWGGALCAFVTQMSPEFVMRSPLPPGVIADHVGALLALVANDFLGETPRPTRDQRALSARIQEMLTQRCCDPALTAGQTAQSLGISLRALHRALAASAVTFGALLIKSRIDVAVRMLESPLFKRLTIAEIGRRAGFSDPSHFGRACRRVTGRRPSEIRLGARFHP